MKGKTLRVLASLAVIGVLMVVSVIIYMRQPMFGSLPDGDRLARIERSPNYANGQFRNQVPTPIKTTEQSELSMWAQTLFGEKGQPRPVGSIPSIKTDLKAINPRDDVVVWLGHSSYFVQLDGQRILIDPVFSENAAPVPLANMAFAGTSIYTAEDMPEIDVLLISHDHYDHLDYPSIQALKSKVRQVVVGLGVGAHFQVWGYDPSLVHEADWNETVEVAPTLKIDVTPARHFSGRTFDRDRSLWVSFVVTSSNRRLFFSGDTGYGSHFSEIGRRFGPFDWVALDMGQYDPRWANVHMNPEQAAQAAEDLNTRVLMPTHVGKFSLSPHDWDEPFRRITAASRGRAYALWTPQIGRSVFLDGRQQSFTAWWEGNPHNQIAAQAQGE